MAVSGLGFGLSVPPAIDIVLVNVDRTRAGAASGTLATGEQMGGAVVVAALGIIFFDLIGHHARTAAADAFAISFTQALWYQVAVNPLTLLLITRLPKVNPRQLAELETAGPAGVRC